VPPAGAGAVALAVVALAGVFAIAACGRDDDERGPETRGGHEAASAAAAVPAPGTTFSADAKFETERNLREDLAAVRDPSDGGGRARIVSLEVRDRRDPTKLVSVDSVPVASRARIRIAFEVGPEGIAPGGVIFLQTSPFFEWRPAQTRFPDLVGYTTATPAAADVELEAETFPGGIAAFTVRGRALRAGEAVELVYGAGPELGRVDRYAERASHIWVMVDGNGDGVRKAVDERLAIRTTPRDAAMLLVAGPTTAEPGDEFTLRASVVDGAGNAGVDVVGEIEFESDPGLEVPASVRLHAADAGSVGFRVRARAPGIHRILARLELDAASSERAATLRARSAPIVVRAGIERILWGDLHGHTSFSDGTGEPSDYFRYARDVAALDVSAITDHDHWGLRLLDAHPDMWETTRRAVRDANAPGRFVALLGYEWTSWLHGHRHVLHFADDGPLLSSMTAGREYETPKQLWDALRGLPALTFAHHSAGGPISTNWHFVPDPELEPVTEIVSVHGSSEALDSPRPIYDPVRGNFVRDVLDRGVRFGLIGSGDSHDGHPGLAWIASGTRSAGLAAILSPERTRAGVLAALRARRVYATNGPRIGLQVRLDGLSMGSTFDPVDAGVQTLSVEVAAAGPLDRIDLVRSGLVRHLDGEGREIWARDIAVPRLAAGEYLYVRALQRDGGAAWSSPFFANGR